MPSYLPILAALVAVYAESHHGEGGYYQALRHALHLPPQWGPLDLAQLDELWDDLDAWSGPKGTAGRYGRLRLAVHGQQKYVGRLRAQCIFRSIDVERIARVFAQVRVQPGEELSLETAARLRVAICDDPALSIGLREAAKDENYAEILTERLQQILGDWDGWVPAVGRGGVHDGGEPTAVEAGRDCAVSHELRLSLHLTHNDVPWRVGWRIACLGDDVRVTLEYDEHRWDAVLRENEEVTATPAGHGNGALLELALQNGRVCLKCDRPKVGALIFRHKLLRYLVWEPHENCLVERDQLPSYGPAYLLRGPDNVNFQRVVSAHRVELQRCPQDGLPIGWELWHVPDCGRLKEVPWPDGYDVHPQPRVLRLVGGVRIRRGGRLLFLPYDLPRVELDAPPETQVTATGLKLVPEPEGTVQEGLHATSLRRFWMTVIDGSRQHFLIEARRANGEVMGSATLRVHTGVAPLSALGDETGLDPSGGSTSREPFLVGVTLRGWNGSSPEPSKFDVAPKDLGQPLEAGWPTPRIRAIAEMRFLDSLAQASIASIPYGVARDRLRRYLQETSSTERVAPLFRDLRSRGLVEIVTDSRGRWTAVAKVRPTLFRLPIVAGHQEVWAVAGTLGFSHWTALAQMGDERRREWVTTSRCPVVRVLGPLGQETTQGFEVRGIHCTDIAQFSTSLVEHRDCLATRGFEQLTGCPGGPDTFNPMLADWTAGFDGPDWVFLRYTDPDTGAHQIHSLQNHGGNPRRFRHVRDERWGQWIAYTACAHWTQQHFGLEGVAPWPLHYDAASGDLWLPGRIRLPYVLERALTAASGGPPEETRLTREPNPNPEVVWGLTTGNARIGPFDANYDQLLPDYDARIWLTYRWIPRELAELIASKLDCRLAALGRA